MDPRVEYGIHQHSFIGDKMDSALQYFRLYVVHGSFYQHPFLPIDEWLGAPRVTTLKLIALRCFVIGTD